MRMLADVFTPPVPWWMCMHIHAYGEKLKGLLQCTQSKVKGKRSYVSWRQEFKTT